VSGSLGESASRTGTAVDELGARAQLAQGVRGTRSSATEECPSAAAKSTDCATASSITSPARASEAASKGV
jgi:hypothetical protein